MSTTFEELFGGGGALGPQFSRPFLQSGTFVAQQDGIAELRGTGGGGSGAKGASCTGGYTGAWGAKLVRVSKGDVITVVIGAGGASPGPVGNGNAGSATTFTVGGVTYTAPGGPGGIYASSGVPVVPDGPALPAGWDIGAGSVKPGAAAGPTGGAGVDILAQGGNATTSASTVGSGGGGTGSPSPSGSGGGALPGGLSISGVLPVGAGVNEDASNREWLISFYGGSGGGGGGSPGGSGGGGGGGAGASAGGRGGNGGGGGSSGSGAAGAGGLGGGGGASIGGISGAGGNGYACIHFYADTGV